MEHDVAYIQINIEYLHLSEGLTKTFTTMVKEVEKVNPALMEALTHIEKVGIYKDHTILVRENK